MRVPKQQIYTYMLQAQRSERKMAAALTLALRGLFSLKDFLELTARATQLQRTIVEISQSS